MAAECENSSSDDGMWMVGNDTAADRCQMEQWSTFKIIFFNLKKNFNFKIRRPFPAFETQKNFQNFSAKQKLWKRNSRLNAAIKDEVVKWTNWRAQVNLTPARLVFFFVWVSRTHKMWKKKFFFKFFLKKIKRRRRRCEVDWCSVGSSAARINGPGEKVIEMDQSASRFPSFVLFGSSLGELDGIEKLSGMLDVMADDLI